MEEFVFRSKWDLQDIPNAPMGQTHISSTDNDPNISSRAMMEGNFDFKKTLLAPPGTKVVVNEKPNIRRIWGQQGLQVWYIGLEF